MTSATVTPVAKVRQAVTMTVSPSWRQEHSDAAAEKGSLRVSRSGDPSWLPISDEDEGSRCNRADFRNESGSAGAAGGQVDGRGVGLGPPARLAPSLPPVEPAPPTAGLASPPPVATYLGGTGRQEMGTPAGQRRTGFQPLGQMSWDPGLELTSKPLP